MPQLVPPKTVRQCPAEADAAVCPPETDAAARPKNRQTVPRRAPRCGSAPTTTVRSRCVFWPPTKHSIRSPRPVLKKPTDHALPSRTPRLALKTDGPCSAVPGADPQRRPRKPLPRPLRDAPFAFFAPDYLLSRPKQSGRARSSVPTFFHLRLALSLGIVIFCGASGARFCLVLASLMPALCARYLSMTFVSVLFWQMVTVFSCANLVSFSFLMEEKQYGSSKDKKHFVRAHT